MRPTFLPVALLSLCLAPWPALAQGTAATSPAGLAASCEGCHGSHGDTRAPQTPRLNGQTREYLMARLKGLRIATNQTISAIHNMLDPVSAMSEAQMSALADHFAAQAPTQPNQHGPAHDRGAQLYAKGRGPLIPACAGCHGETGQGVGEAARLAGQHSVYLQDQMNVMTIGAREQGDMNKHVWNLTQDEVQALAAYLGSD